MVGLDPAPDWSCEVEVQIFDYPFAPLVGVSSGGLTPSVASGSPRLLPNPSRREVRIRATLGAVSPNDGATLEITDVSGRIVRRMSGLLGAEFLWDGRDQDGRTVGAGVYLYRLASRRWTWFGKSCLLR